MSSNGPKKPCNGPPCLLGVGHGITGVVLKRGEVAYAVANDVQLVEPRRAPGQNWTSYSSGTSWRTGAPDTGRGRAVVDTVQAKSTRA